MKITIGRGQEGEQKIDLSNTGQKGVSRKHCTIETIGSDGETVEIEDFSSFGTYICKTNIASQIPDWNPKYDRIPAGLNKINGRARASVNDSLFLGPEIHATIKEWMVKKNGERIDTPNDSTRLYTSSYAYDYSSLNQIFRLKDFKDKFGNQLSELKQEFRNQNSGLAPHVYPLILAANAEDEIENYRMKEAQQDLYQAGDIMYEIAKQGDPQMEMIYAEIMTVLCVLYKKVFAIQAFNETKEATISIYKHLGKQAEADAVNKI